MFRNYGPSNSRLPQPSFYFQAYSLVEFLQRSSDFVGGRCSQGPLSPEEDVGPKTTFGVGVKWS